MRGAAFDPAANNIPKKVHKRIPYKRLYLEVNEVISMKLIEVKIIIAVIMKNAWSKSTMKIPAFYKMV